MMPAEDVLPGGQALSRAVVPTQYVLGPGDGLTVNLWGEYDDKYEVKITPDGKISLPTIGTLKLKGLTLAQAEALVETEVNKYFRNVKSGVSLTSLRVFEVLVLGEVQAPGAYTATPVRRVSDVVALAGGVLNGGSQRNVQIQRGGKVVATADLVAYLRQGDETANPFLQDGDVVYVQTMGDSRVSVFITEVTPGPPGGPLTESSVPYVVEVKKGERFSVLVSEVGGVSPWWDLEGVFIQRVVQHPEGTMRLPVDLKRYLYERDESQNPVLENGDQVFIPSSVRRVFIAGSVKQPAAYTFFPGKNAEDYIMLAGGPSITADFERSYIRRADGTVEPYQANVELNNGDTVIVLEKMFKTYQDYIALVGVVTGAVFTLLSLFTIQSLLKK